MLVCNRCYRPNSNEETCSYCSGDKFREIDRQYSIKQWQNFISSFKNGTSHDFYPHEFNEDGTINRGAGMSGSSGPVSPNGAISMDSSAIEYKIRKHIGKNNQPPKTKRKKY